MYRSKREFEPLLPPLTGELQNALITAAQASAALSEALPAATSAALGAVLRQMNSYYSNLIEGHGTRPLDIERALNGDFAKQPEQRALQLEARAHVEVQELIEARLAAEPDLRICSPDFIRWIHAEFYRRMPDEFRFVTEGHTHIQVRPGIFRTRDVQVGRHVPPAHQSIGEFMERFAEVYEPSRLDKIQQFAAAATSHHRLAWIHPFLDGNGRVVRLFTHAYLRRVGLGSGGLWSMARGMARQRDRYFSALSAADRPREGDTDGRGNLSQRGLLEFVRFFCETAHDQIDFMRGRLALEGLSRRIERFGVRLEDSGELMPGAHRLLLEAVRRGTFPRGEADRIIGASVSHARKVLSATIRAGLLRSDTERGPVQLAFPVRALVHYFPELYPASEEALLMS